MAWNLHVFFREKKRCHSYTGSITVTPVSFLQMDSTLQ